MFGIRKLFRQILERLQALEEAAASYAGAGARSSEQLALRISELSGAANRHDMAIEDLLDSWEELQEKQKEETRALSSALAETAAKEQKEAQEREKVLLELLMDAHDLLYGLQRAAADAGAEAWSRQLALAEQKLTEAGLPSGFQVVDKTGIPVSFAVHEVTEALPAPEPTLNHLIAEVYACGYVFRGRVLRKARVSVWRRTDGVSQENAGGASI